MALLEKDKGKKKEIREKKEIKYRTVKDRIIRDVWTLFK